MCYTNNKTKTHPTQTTSQKALCINLVTSPGCTQMQRHNRTEGQPGEKCQSVILLYYIIKVNES